MGCGVLKYSTGIPELRNQQTTKPNKIFVQVYVAVITSITWKLQCDMKFATFPCILSLIIALVIHVYCLAMFWFKKHSSALLDHIQRVSALKKTLKLHSETLAINVIKLLVSQNFSFFFCLPHVTKLVPSFRECPICFYLVS